MYDVAGGIANAVKKDIAHRDITPNNFGQLEGRGYLHDFSAAKVSGTATITFVVTEMSPAKLSLPNKNYIDFHDCCRVGTCIRTMLPECCSHALTLVCKS